MPPGIDGRETARRIRNLDEDVQIVIVTGYSDHAPHQVAAVAGPIDKLFYVSKPFDRLEIRQLASSLSARWHLTRDLKATQAALREKLALVEDAYSELATSEAKARHASLHDSLTGLANRLSFSQQLRKRLAAGRQTSLLFVDLDRFKQVNDTVGHIGGDALVKAVAAMMGKALPPGSVLARLGGDEFGVLIDGDGEQTTRVCHELIQMCAQPHMILGKRLSVTASIGVAATSSDDLLGDQELLRRADLALYVAKREGRNRFAWFRQDLDDGSKVQRQIVEALQDALDKEELSLVYQPIVDSVQARAVGFEALVRWNSPVLGELSPSLFVPIAEESGQILALGRWIIREAIREAIGWPDAFLSLNLSPVQFTSDELADYIVDECRAAGMPPSRVQLEITETSLFANLARASQVMSALRQEGFRFALDDFGTGYSSLVHLKQFPLDCIKIDRSFVSAMTTDPQARAIVRSVTSLARALGMSVIAEGVESHLQEIALRQVGCGLHQGYLLGKPTPYPMDWTPAAAERAGPLAHVSVGERRLLRGWDKVAAAGQSN
jgi:diguanylate cyclase (GGDEF)-like protein